MDQAEANSLTAAAPRGEAWRRFEGLCGGEGGGDRGIRAGTKALTHRNLDSLHWLGED